jgi:5-methyltetrahydropteroyltriglutamate--homocysteine methyltransferase
MKTEKTSRLPRFYTHVIGSLPRPRAVLELLGERRRMAPKRYARLIDEMVVFAIRLQELAGIDVVSDGEWRRTHYTDEFLERIGGFAPARRFMHQGEEKTALVAVDRIPDRGPVFADDARFLAAHAEKATKFALPSPFLIAVRYWHRDHSAGAYPTMEHFLDHCAAVVAKEAAAVAEAGIDVVQIDDPALTYFCDRRLTSGERIHDDRLDRKWDAARELPRAVEAINRVAEGLRAEVHLHCCHSVYHRMSDVSGDYKPLLPYLERANVDRLNLEFAYTGTGDVSDLALLPRGMNLGMGVIDVRREAMPVLDDVVMLVSKAVDTLGADRIALNPDCGFAPGATEPPTIDEAFGKLKLLSAAAAVLREKYPEDRSEVQGSTPR